MTFRLPRLRLALTRGLLMLMLAFIGMLAMPIRAQGEPVTWYVDGNCAPCGQGTLDAPFQTIHQALATAGNGDTILVAQGTFTENLLVNDQVTLMGGYRAQGGAWTRDVARYETIIASGDRTVPGDWNGDWIGSPCVIVDEHAYRMWYLAGNEIDGESIGYADSPDGVHWFQPYAVPLLNPGPSDTWDEGGVTDPTVLSTEDGLHMWYVGSNVFGERAIGYATSPDALTWRKYYANPVLRPDSADADAFGHPTVVQDGPGDYKMWYSGGGKIWLATSSDGINWTKHLDTPALSPGSPCAWDGDKVYAPIVVACPDQYEVWYVGESTEAPGGHIGYACSNDGLTWTKSPSNPVLAGQPGYWEEGIVTYPAVIAEGATDYKMWYRGGDSTRQAIGQATSTDGLGWTRYKDNPVLTQGKPTHWGAPVVTFGSESSGAVLDGFTITHGDAEYGGGILAYETSPIIRACQVVGNMAYRGGGGLWLGGGTSVVERAMVSDNASSQSGGGISVSSASVVIRDSSITNNVARDYGGGMTVWEGARFELMATTIAGNAARWGGGLSVGGDGALYISNGRIEDNRAQRAAGMRMTDATLVMTNTFVVNNTATTGGPGGIQFWDASGRLVNVTIADNDASDGLGGIVFGTGDPARQLVILNSILFFNGGDLNCSGGTCTVTYSDVSESITGPGNISVDPQFVDRTAGDYHLRPGSPAIDAGTSEGAPLFDFEGDPRPAGRVDMGADEF